ncbi:MAG: phosphoribosylamine--glycine ligase [Candidatus Aenigmarchaeota archaeon]|nr:phosphoribosylamine--glycine ligase [Candidatus Aenigmarchaeota archaeon]
MKVLVVGSGGREHAIAWKLRRELYGNDQLFVASGNAGTAEIAQNIAIQPDDILGLTEFARSNKIGMTFVGPDLPVVLGIADSFQEYGLPIVGPNQTAAQLEGSKIFANEFAERQGIPHPRSVAAYTIGQALSVGDYMLHTYGVGVAKADGLAAGKGVIVYRNRKELENAVDEIVVKNRWGGRLLMQEFMEGQEASFIGFTDGTAFLPLPYTQDHKQIFDNDLGPNTGGMGAYARAPIITDEMEDKIMRDIVMPTLNGLEQDGIQYKGILYFGIMIKNGQPYLLEYNCRGGDPETQPAMALLQSSLLDIGYAVNEGNLNRIKPKWSPQSAVTVVLASQGYPSDDYKNHLGREIFNLQRDDVIPFHAGTSRRPDGKIITSGGRVVGVTALGNSLQEAISRAYAAIGKENKGVYFDGMLYRTDVGKKGLSLIGRV